MTQIDPTSQKNNNVAGKTLASINRVATIILGAALAVVAFYLFLAIQLGAWQMYALSAIIAGFAIANALAIIAIRKGNSERGSWTIIIGMMVIFPAAVLLIDGISVIFGAALFALVATVSTQTLSAKKARRANIYAAIVGVLTAFLGLLSLDYRLLVPEIQAFVPAITVVIVVIVAFFTIRQSWGAIVTFWRTSIRNRLTTIILITALAPVLLISGILGVTTYTQVRETLTQTTFDRLDAIQSIKIEQLDRYFNERSSDMAALKETIEALRKEAFTQINAVTTLKESNIARLFEDWSADVRDVALDSGVIQGLQGLSNGFETLGADQVRNLYLANPSIENAGDESEYSLAHFEQHSFFTAYIEIHGYEDAFLIDTAGNIIYSVSKNDSFGTNLVTGPFSESNLAELYQNVLELPSGEIYVADAGEFEGETHLFMGTPIYNGTKLSGMLVYQLPEEEINEVMSEDIGLGATSETFLVALEDDGRITLRNARPAVNEAFVIGFDITDRSPKFVKDAANGISGEILEIGGQGEAVAAVYAPLNIAGLNWAIIGKVGAEEALVPKHDENSPDYFNLYAENYGYYDIFLIDNDGFVFYSVAKEADYHTNILTGEYKNTSLSELTAEVLKEREPLFTDIAFYEPSGGAPAAFFGIPVYENPDDTGEIAMIVVAQVPIDDFNTIMNEASGLGETGESYIIGPDFLGRMDSRFIDNFDVETTVLNEEFSVNTEAVNSAIAGNSGQGVITDYRGLPVVSVWDPFYVHEADAEHPEGQVWAIMTEIDESEALTPVNQLSVALGTVIGLAVLGIGAIAAFLGTRFAISFVEPILGLTDTATAVAGGNLDLRVATDSEDEIGTLTTAFNTMTAQLQETLGGLETRVAARTKDLATVANISTVTATIRDPEEMLTNLVQLTQRGFGLYHAHVFTFEEESNLLSIVACGYREGDEHEGTHGTTTIPLGQEQSLVAIAARTRQPVIVNDVRNEPGWLPNPELPDTRSELAVPMLVGDELLGVLDVQSEHENAFTEEDANIQMTLASQIATALQNALTYERTQKRAELESLVNVIGQRIQRSASIEETLQIAIRELGTAIGAKRVNASITPTPVDKATSEKVETVPQTKSNGTPAE